MPERRTILLAGASRGLGLGLAREYLGRGWRVIATARAPDQATGLAGLLDAHPDRLVVERLDVAAPPSILSLSERMTDRALDVLFVVAGVSGHSNAPIHAVPQEAASREFITNAIGPLTLAEALRPRLAPGGAVVFMTSILGSIASNAGGGMELYRASKAALNMLASCYALRHRETPVLLLHPGWVRTDMGGPDATLDVDTSVKGMANVIEAHGAKPGIAYLDYAGTKLPW